VSEKEIARLRDDIAAVDKEIVALVAKRLHLAEQVGLEKKLSGLPLRAADVEEQVQSRMLRECGVRGISEAFASSLAQSLIDESLQRQAALRLPERQSQHVLVVGGAGQMGQWLARYFRSRGHEVVVHDPAGPVEGFAFEPDLPRAIAEADVIAVSVPMSSAAAVLEEIAALHPAALVFDICSIKAPVEKSLRSMGASGLRVASVHPMFGPNFWPLSSGTILVTDCGNAVAALEAKELFRASGAALMDVSLDHHDELMAFLLGLSHLSLLTFARAVADSPFDLAGLRRPAGTTFSRLSVAASGLLADPPELLRDIQALNSHTPSVHRRLREALDDWRRATEDSDGKDFATMVQRARAYFGGPHP
jgi:chorismate mutase / prephenate dehydrogenase